MSPPISTHNREPVEGFPEGLQDKLRAADKHWYALYLWGHLLDEAETPVFFLNPAGDNNFGRFTLADLEAWVENKGPIPKVASR